MLKKISVITLLILFPLTNSTYIEWGITSSKVIAFIEPGWNLVTNLALFRIYPISTCEFNDIEGMWMYSSLQRNYLSLVYYENESGLEAYYEGIYPEDIFSLKRIYFSTCKQWTQDFINCERDPYKEELLEREIELWKDYNNSYDLAYPGIGGAIWIRANNSCYFISEINPCWVWPKDDRCTGAKDPKEIKLIQGFNYISIMPWMVNYTFAQIFEDCEVKHAYKWNNWEQTFEISRLWDDPSEKITNVDVGDVIVINVQNICNFSYPG